MRKIINTLFLPGIGLIKPKKHLTLLSFYYRNEEANVIVVLESVQTY